MECSRKEKLAELFEHWREKHKAQGLQNFIYDGIVNEEIWIEQPLKVCVFLKEAYLTEEDKKSMDTWDIAAWLKAGALKKMWHNVAEWAYAIKHTTEDILPKRKVLSDDDKRAELQSIAVVNVKKSNGKSHSEWGDLVTFAKEDAALIRQEIEIIDPDVIVCGNNASLLRVVYGASVDEDGKILDGGTMNGQALDGKKMYEEGFQVCGNRIVIDYYHPANQFPKMVNYYCVSGVWMRALKEKEGK